MNAKRLLPPSLLLIVGLAIGCGTDGDDGMGPDPGDDAPTGTLAITTASSGKQIDPDGYGFQVDGGVETAIGPNAAATVTLAVGTHIVTLTGVDSNCRSQGDLSRPVIVTEGQTSHVDYAIGCAPTLEDVIVFASDRDGGADLYTMSPDGTSVTRFTTLGNAYDPAVSPDGQTVAFTYNDDQIWAVDADGTNLRRLTDLGHGPVWSADGARIAFESDRAGTYDIWWMDAHGGSQTNLTNDASGDETEPTWSPDGMRLAYAGRVGTSRKIWTIDADGSNAAPLTGVAGDETFPAWSPDGTEIAYTSTRCRPVDLLPCGDWELHVIGADGTGDRFLTSNLTKDIRPAWSADGARIAYTGDETGNYEIYVMDADGSHVVNLTVHGAEDTVFLQSWAR